MKKKIVVAITGASGSIYAQRLIHHLQSLSEQIEDVGVVCSLMPKMYGNMNSVPK